MTSKSLTSRWYFFLFDINDEDIVISKLVSQLKLLPSLIRLKDNDTIVMSTIIKKLPEMWGNGSLLIAEVGKIVRFFLLSQATRWRKWRRFFCFEAHKDILQVNHEKPHGEITNFTLQCWCMFTLILWIMLT